MMHSRLWHKASEVLRGASAGGRSTVAHLRRGGSTLKVKAAGHFFKNLDALFPEKG
jgi:hypothetical protein